MPRNATKRELILQNTQLVRRLQAQRKAARIALRSLNNMTTEQFSRGRDRRTRQLLGFIVLNTE
jgi:hypothetical protein